MNKLTLEVVADVRKATQQLRAFGGQVRQLERTAKEAGRSFKGFAASVEGFASRLSSLKAALGGLAVGVLASRALGALTEVIRQGIRAAEDEEEAIRGLHQTLISMGRYTPELEKRLIALASALELQSAYGNEAILSAAKLLATYGQISDKVLPRALKATLDLARGFRYDLRTAANMVGKASMGLTAELRRAGVTVDRFTFETKGFVGVLEQMGTQANKQAQIWAQTAKGARALMQTTASDVLKQFGWIINEGLTPFRRAFAQAFAQVAEDLQRVRTGELTEGLRRAREEADRLAQGLSRAWLGLWRLSREGAPLLWQLRHFIPVMGPVFLQLEALGAREAERGRRSREDYERLSEILDTIRSKNALLAQLEDDLARLERERTEAVKEGAQERIRALKEELQTLEDQRRAILRAIEESQSRYQQFGQKVAELTRRIAEGHRQIAEDISRIRTRGMTPEEQEAERVRRLRALYEDYWLAADPERKEELANKIRELALALKDENDAIRWLREADQLRTQALEEQKAKAEEAQKAEAGRLEELRSKLKGVDEELKAVRSDLEGAKKLVEELTERRTVLQIDADISQVRQKIEEVKRELERLNRVKIEIEAKLKTEGAPGFQFGGPVPGYGGGDRVPALLEPGEFVLRKEVVRELGLGFLERLNSRLSSLRAMPSLPTPERWNASESGKVFTLVIGEARIQAMTDGEMLKRLERAFKRYKLVGANP